MRTKTWAVVGGVLVSFVAGSAGAIYSHCIGQATVIHPDGSQTECSQFCYVYHEDGSYAGYICSQ